MTAASIPSRLQDVDRYRIIHVIQGEYVVTADADAVLTTVLGSCVAACIFDPGAGVGGMNHFLLPGDVSGGAGDDLRYGANSMELLINGILKLGAQRERLKAKLFGGAEIVAGLSNIGAKNAEFATRYLQKESIALVGGDLGGGLARRLQFWPATGRVRQVYVQEAPSKIAEAEIRKSRHRAQPDGDLELF